ncbi:MAG TPA: hypothetical protein VF659_19220 [Pyrinomonadaceae bacterium]|jgi:hypothetical protein
MGDFGKWLLREEQKELFDYLFAVALNAVFLALAALLLWPLGKAAAAVSLARGFWAFWTLLILTSMLLVVSRRLLRVDLDTHPDAYVITGLAVSGVSHAGWAAYAALTVRGAADGAPVWVAAVLYFVGLLSCWVAFNVVAAYYMGSIYRTVNLFVAPAAYVLFCLWPAAARALFGRFFDFYGRFLDPYGWFSAIF